MKPRSRIPVVLLFASALVLFCLFFSSLRLNAAPLAQPACPPNPQGVNVQAGTLTSSIPGGNFCVYYGSAATTVVQAQTVAVDTTNYWNTYTGFGFNQPLFGPQPLGVLIRPITTTCNGITNSSQNSLEVWQGCFDPLNPLTSQSVTGHELFHRVQYAHDPGESKWLKEGTARAMQDLTDQASDHWLNGVNVGFSFNAEVTSYLRGSTVGAANDPGGTDQDITSDPLRYRSALWWKYFTEQYGRNINEPERGVDALVALWQAAQGANDIAAVNQALNNLNAGVNFDAAFRRFVAANLIKDLVTGPGPFNYIDEEEAGNSAIYGPVVITTTGNGTISAGSAATFNNRTIDRYSAAYYGARPSNTNCPAVTARLHTDSGPAFYHVVAQNGNTLVKHVDSTADQWSQSFFNNGLSRVVVIAGSTANTASVDIDISCVNPVLTIQRPISGAIAHVGPASAPGKLLVQLQVTNGSPTGPVVGGFTHQDFGVRVNSVPATVTGGGFVQEQYWMVVQAPVQSSDGVYDLEVSLQQPGSPTALASDTNTASVSYSSTNLDHVLVLDRSGSMTDTAQLVDKLTAAQDAASFYVDIARDGDGLSVVPFNGDVSPTPYALQASNTAVRNEAKSYVRALTADGWTSIGDGLAEAVKQQAAAATSNSNCSFVVLSDGMENKPLKWAQVKADVLKSGCSVSTIAFGPESDEKLLQEIAADTGGDFHDVYVSSEAAAAAGEPPVTADEMVLELGDAYEYIQTMNRRQQRLTSEGGTASLECNDGSVNSHSFTIDDTVSEAFIRVNWLQVAGRRVNHLVLKLVTPTGAVVSIPMDWDSQTGHMIASLPGPQRGVWTVRVGLQACPITISHPTDATAYQGASMLPYQIDISARTDLTLHLLLPGRLHKAYLTGNRVPIYAMLSSTSPIGDTPLVATVTAPNRRRSSVRLYDDGLHGDGTRGDGLYGGLYTLATEAAAVQPTGDPDVGEQSPPIAEGSYRVRVKVTTPEFQREARGSFVVLGSPDSNNNGLPDAYETENGVTDPNADPDLDGLPTGAEYQAGTDPNNSDTDDSGENDGCEVSPHGLDPLNPDDDQIARPDYFSASADIGANVLRYHIRPEYTASRLYRATSLSGPWEVRAQNLPATGVYTDTAVNGQTYVYRFLAFDANAHCTAVLDSVAVTPSTDPFPPEAYPVINFGAPKTNFPQVVVTFAPYEDTRFFGDITEVKFSNNLSFTGAIWQPFQVTMPWTLSCNENDAWTHLYVLLRDSAGNESLIEIGSIRCTDDILDSDGDGIPDHEEGPGDADGDGIPDYLDADTPTADDPTEEPQSPGKAYLPLINR